MWNFLSDDNLGLMDKLGEDLCGVFGLISDEIEPDEERGLKVNFGLCILKPWKLITVILQIYVRVNLATTLNAYITTNIQENTHNCYVFHGHILNTVFVFVRTNL